MDERRRVLSVASGLALLLALIGVGVYALARARGLHLANHDIGWFLHAGGVWLAGGEIGVDIVDTNPPLVIWLSGLEVQLASWLGASPFVVHALVSCAVGLLGVGLATRAFQRAGLAREVLSLWAPLTLVAATAVSGYEFGQREHWLALLLLPYAGWAFVPRAWSRERAFAGLLAALAVALKPHYVLAVALIELFGLASTRRARQLLRTESLCAAACVPLYLLAIAWSAPSYWTDIQDTLAVYAAYGREVPPWSRHTLLALLALALAVPVGLLRPRTGVPGLLAAFALLCARAVRRTGLAVGLLGLVTAGCLGALYALPLVPRDPEQRSALRDGIERLAEGETLCVFSTGVGAAFPVVNFSNSSGARSLAPYSCLWPIAGNYTPEERGAARFPYRTLAEMTAVERRMVERVVAVLVRDRPRLLVFDHRSRKPAFGRTALDLRRYFEAHPDFVALLGSYRSLAQDDFFEYYGRIAD